MNVQMHDCRTFKFAVDVKASTVKKNPCFTSENVRKVEYGRRTAIPYLFSVVSVRKYYRFHGKMYGCSVLPRYGMSRPVVEQTFSVVKSVLFFCCCFLTVFRILDAPSVARSVVK